MMFDGGKGCGEKWGEETEEREERQEREES